MARPRELLSLVSIADETGISYATLRNYALKFADEIPSEGEGRNTRYPRSAVKVFQRLRRESKPGRKPKNAFAPAIQPPAPATPTPTPVRLDAPLRMERPVRLEVPAPAPRPAGTDTSGMEKELAAIRGFLERIADSLEQLASAPRSAAPAPEPPVPAEAKTEAPAPLPLAPAAPEAEPKKLSVPLPSIDMRGAHEPGGHRRLHSLPKVMGQRGKRPE
jgi:hypothetical protein